MAPQVGLEPTTLRLTGEIEGHAGELQGKRWKKIKQFPAGEFHRVPAISTQFTDKTRTAGKSLTAGADMGNECRTCAHPERQAIELALISGESPADVAERYHLTRFTVSRHHRDHIAPRIAQELLQSALMPRPRDAKALKHTFDIARKLGDLIDEAERLKQVAERGGDVRGALIGIGRQKEIYELLAKITGEIDGRMNVNVNVGVDPAEMVGYQRFIHETRWLPESKYQLVWDFIRTIEEPPTAETTAQIVPPEDSPLWREEGPLGLTEGDSTRDLDPEDAKVSPE
jgi:hypothetical protein